mmetsp:Transcript_64766/g.163016  ORF Transcript_64766/g.163016 Transcript_64766/m.163016 type:complete len:112 (-) Transcript_64766:1380-1715(-)
MHTADGLLAAQLHAGRLQTAGDDNETSDMLASRNATSTDDASESASLEAADPEDGAFVVGVPSSTDLSHPSLICGSCLCKTMYNQHGTTKLVKVTKTKEVKLMNCDNAFGM